jgi:DNA-binding transcriptional regulator YiaG
MQSLPSLPSGAPAFNPVDFGQQSLFHSFALALPPGHEANMLPANAQFARDPGEQALVKEHPPKIGPVRATIGSGFSGCHTHGIYIRGVNLSSGKVKSEEKSDCGVHVRQLREARGETPAQFARHFLGRKGLPMTSQSVWNWENGYTRPSNEHYIKMGNIAPDPEERLYFWSVAGLDIELMSKTVAVLPRTRDGRKVG